MEIRTLWTVNGQGPATDLGPRPGDRGRCECGSILVEFAMISLALSIILAASIDFGRLMFSAQGIQDVARVAARELAVTPLDAAAQFDEALVNPIVQQRVFNPACLVINVADPVVASDPDAFIRGLPVVNKALVPLMISDRPNGANLMRYPGALLTDGSMATCDSVQAGGVTVSAAATGLTVKIPYVRDTTGELIAWLDVLEEIRPDSGCPERGPFPLVYDGARDACGALASDPLPSRGLAAVRINYPFQAAAMTGFHPNPEGPAEPTIGNPILTSETTCDPPAGFALAGDPTAVGPYAGDCGLGRQFAFAGQVVRPFRKVVSAQSIYRREVFQ
jgi:hypothetical protein